MSFILPFLPALIGAGATIGGTALANRKSGEEKAALDMLAGTSEKLTGIAEGFEPAATGLIDMAGKSFSPAIDYWTKILSGDRGSVLESLSPEIEQLTTGIDTARQTASELTPRGGGSAALMAELPYAKAGGIMDLINKSRTTAATQLPKIGTSAGYLGSYLGGNILNALSGANQASLGTLDYSLGRRQSDLNVGTAMGGGIGNLLDLIDWDEITKSSGSGVDSNTAAWNLASP